MRNNVKLYNYNLISTDKSNLFLSHYNYMNQRFYSNACYVKYHQQFNIYSRIFFDGSVLR